MFDWILKLSPIDITVSIAALISVAALLWTIVLFRKLTSPSRALIEGELSAELERALFKKLWAWLSILGAAILAITVGAWVLISAGFAGEARDAANREARAALERQLVSQRLAFEQQKRALAQLQADTEKIKATSEGIIESLTQRRVQIAEIATAAKARADAAEEAAKAAALELLEVRKLRAATNATRANGGNEVDLPKVVLGLADNTDFQDAVAASALKSLNGIVVASTLRCSQLPGGWIEYEEAIGKFIMGSGTGELRYRGPHRPEGASNVVSLTPVNFGDQGGTETHTLTIAEMPSHDHAQKAIRLQQLTIPDPPEGKVYLTVPENRPQGKFEKAEWVINASGSMGETEPHNNMPPYLALYFCKKEAG